jgi:hypothetical protein
MSILKALLLIARQPAGTLMGSFAAATEEPHDKLLYACRSIAVRDDTR